MNRTIMAVGVVTVFAMAPFAFVSAATPSTTEASFLKKAAQGQQAEIALGQLAAQNASAPEVKQFGSKMIEDHQKASQEVKQLASKEGVKLPLHMSDKQKQKEQELSKLSGTEFDRAYMQYMLKDHKKEVKEFEQNAQQLQDQDVKQWASSTLPVLKQHLEKAQTIASSLGD
jgi:putative membrane protein